MNTIAQLIDDVARARNEFIALLENIDEQQASYKPSAEAWSITDNTEHLFWQSRVVFMACGRLCMPFARVKPYILESEHKGGALKKL